MVSLLTPKSVINKPELLLQSEACVFLYFVILLLMILMLGLCLQLLFYGT